MTKAESKKLIPQAKEFVEKCSVIPLVHAKEGGVIYLEELLVDFVKYLDDKSKTKQSISNKNT